MRASSFDVRPKMDQALLDGVYLEPRLSIVLETGLSTTLETGRETRVLRLRSG